jgi:hypothetical protein
MIIPVGLLFLRSVDAREFMPVVLGVNFETFSLICSEGFFYQGKTKLSYPDFFLDEYHILIEYLGMNENP